MVNTRNVVIAVLVLAAGAAAYILFSDSEEARIRKRFRVLGETFQKDAGETQFASALKADSVRDFFTETSNINAPAYAFSRDVARKDLPGYILPMRAQYASLSVDFTDFVIAFPSENMADVVVTATVTGKIYSGENTRDIQEMSCRLQKVEDTWLLREIEMVQVLEK